MLTILTDSFGQSNIGSIIQPPTLSDEPSLQDKVNIGPRNNSHPAYTHLYVLSRSVWFAI